MRHENKLLTLKMNQDEQVKQLRDNFEVKAKELQNQYEYRGKSIRYKLEIGIKNQVEKITKEKEDKAKAVKERHEKEFHEIKNYFSDITHNNLDLIRNLKEELVELKKRETANEKALTEIANRNKKLTEPLKQALQQIEILKQDQKQYQDLKIKCEKLSKQVKKREKEKNEAEWELEIILQKLDIIRNKKKSIEEKLRKTINQIETNNEVKNLILQQSIEDLLSKSKS